MKLRTLGLRCSKGCGPLEYDSGWHCSVCQWTPRQANHYLDFVEGEIGTPSGVGPRLMYSESLVRVYERLWRPMFVSVLGASPADVETEFQNVRRALSPACGSWIADLSCGPGVMGRRLAQCGDFSGVVGLDLSRPMLHQAAQYIQRDQTELFTLVRADIVHQPFLNGSLGGAHAGAALHLWPDVPGALHEIARTLRPGAPFVATTFFASPRRFIGLGQRLVGRSISTRFFDESWLRRQLLRAGFENVVLTRRAAYGFLTATRVAH